ncbi:MAG: GPGG-motif small membrane protein [Actinomycetota bacterium]|nr:GPGG-motif small membrane protein [Actinomycetota bacterium]
MSVPEPGSRSATLYLIALVLAAISFIWGVVTLIRGRLLLGIVLIVCSFLVGPGGYSIPR